MMQNGKQNVTDYCPYAEADHERRDEPFGAYKGLSTSITHMFADPATQRSDCCSIACGGILQSDYNRYILLGKRPPSFKQRLLQHVLVPLSFFSTAGFCAITIQDRNLNQLLCTAFVFLCVGWTIGGCMRSGYKRCFFRRALLKKAVQQQHGVSVLESEDEDDDHLMLPQTNFEMMCAHRGCGCYKSDLTKDRTKPGDAPKDLCGYLFKAFANMCCGKIVGYHWQICGTCALAQEGRQLDSMVHINKRRMDYVTFQFFTDYFNQIRKLRDEADGNLLNHYRATSKLSQMILRTFCFIILIVFILSMTKIPDNFHFGNMLVFVATFFQAFLILFVVHWRLHRFDLSLDAVIKYFASGFILSITSALFFELVISLFLQLVFLIIMPTHVANNDGGYEQHSQYRQYFTFIEHSSWNMYTDFDGYQSAFHRQHPFISTIFLFLNAYFVAAFVEELCKYFGFIMVEHPDFLCDSELEAAAEFSACDGEDDDDSGVVGDESDEDSVAEVAVGEKLCDSFEGGVVQNLRVLAPRQSSRFLGDNIDTNGGIKQRVEIHPAPPRSSRSVGSGITVAMVSVALGYACCENLFYIFLYHNDSLGSEIIVLIFRSLFPVHPLCAAIQSIGLCKRQLESDQSMQLGRIVLPAILLHGSYDFVLMFLSFTASFDEDDGNVGFWGSIISLILSIIIIVIGWLYYLKERDAQNVRLDQIDAERKFVGIRA